MTTKLPRVEEVHKRPYTGYAEIFDLALKLQAANAVIAARTEAAVRERCATIADEFAISILDLEPKHTPVGVLVTMATGKSIAAAIRALPPLTAQDVPPGYWDKLSAAMLAAPKLPDDDKSGDPPPFDTGAELARIGYPLSSVAKCATCLDTGMVPVGNSGLESDGNAVEYERCPECGYPVDDVQRDAVPVLHDPYGEPIPPHQDIVRMAKIVQDQWEPGPLCHAAGATAMLLQYGRIVRHHADTLPAAQVKP